MNLVLEEALPSEEAPQEVDATHMAPCTSMCFPYGIFTVVPVLTTKLAPGATVTLPVRVCVPDQVS